MELLIAPCTISTIALAIVTYVISQLSEDLQFYTSKSGFMSMNAYFVGTIITFYSLAAFLAKAQEKYCSEAEIYTSESHGCIHEKTISTDILGKWYLLPILYFVFYIIFTANLTLRAEYYVKGARIPTTTGAFYLFLCIVILCGVLAFSTGSHVFLLLFPIGWTMLLVWQWMFL